MGIIVDTNVFIDAENGQRQLSQLLASSNDTCFIAAITVSELLTGVALAQTPAIRLHRLTFSERIVSHFPVLDFTTEIARTYAELYAQCLVEKPRKKIAAHDLQIAATAITHGYRVLTSNAADFKNIKGLEIITP
ncbi:MAG: PIN domain-containing protein [Thermodesulfobacteriota bacterium]|nr:PIN domain-containing protein [Thermodesulfobacteriota bacterium]